MSSKIFALIQHACAADMRIAPAADGLVDRDVPYQRTVRRLAGLMVQLYNLVTELFWLRDLQSRELTHNLPERNLRHKLDNLRHKLDNLQRQFDSFRQASFRFGDTFACLKSVAPKSIFDMAKRLCSSASPNVCGADWISARPKSESHKLLTDSEFNTGKSFGSRNELAGNESHPRAEHGIKEGKAKTPADWVVSTAAPHHATGNHDLLSGFIIEHDDQFIHAVDGIPMKVFARGAVVTDTMVLPDVWFVPGLTGNLVSVTQLAELDYSIEFGFGECSIRCAANGDILGKAHLQERGQYVLDFLKVPLAI